jgi:hypothetical protein
MRDYRTNRLSTALRLLLMSGAVTLGISACVTPPRAPEAAHARSLGAIRLAADSARIIASDGHGPCSAGSQRCGKPARMQVGSAEIWFTNLTSCTSDSAAEALLVRLDGTHGPVAFMLQTGDVVVMTERYLAWLDTTWSPDDPIAGGLLRGLWNITFPLGPCHAVRVPDAGRDALLPGATSRGAGHSLILNTDPACVDGGSVGGSRVPLEFAAEWERHPRVTWRTAGEDIDYTVAGHFTNLEGRTNLDPRDGAVASMAYRVTYGFERRSQTIAIGTRIWRDGSARPVTVSQLFAADFDTERYPFQAEQYSVATVRRRFSLNPFPQVAAGRVADDPPRADLVYTTWTAGPPSLRPGTRWTMYSNPPLRRSLSVLITAESDEFLQRYSLAEHASWNQTNSDSLTFMAIQSQPRCGESPRLSDRYSLTLALELKVSSATT